MRIALVVLLCCSTLALCRPLPTLSEKEQKQAGIAGGTIGGTMITAGIVATTFAATKGHSKNAAVDSVQPGVKIIDEKSALLTPTPSSSASSMHAMDAN